MIFYTSLFLNKCKFSSKTFPLVTLSQHLFTLPVFTFRTPCNIPIILSKVFIFLWILMHFFLWFYLKSTSLNTLFIKELNTNISQIVITRMGKLLSMMSICQNTTTVLTGMMLNLHRRCLLQQKSNKSLFSNFHTMSLLSSLLLLPIS